MWAPWFQCSRLERIEGLIERGIADGAVLVAGWPVARPWPATTKGNLSAPTIFSGVKPGMSVYDQAIFGPCCAWWRPPQICDQAIEFINANPTGNGTAIFTQVGPRRSAQVPGRDRRGPGGHQRANPGAAALFSFTGSRASKLGDLGPYGKQAALFYTQTKTGHRPLV